MEKREEIYIFFSIRASLSGSHEKVSNDCLNTKKELFFSFPALFFIEKEQIIKKESLSALFQSVGWAVCPIGRE